jgi:large subunit ribosomal protein L25
MATKQIPLTIEPREATGKGAASRLRRDGRVPAIVYGYAVDATPVSVDALDLYHTLHTDAGRNVLIRLELDGDVHLAVARDLQTHPVRGDYVHVDLLTVDKDVPISVEVPVHLTDEEEIGDSEGVVNQILYTVPILVKPLDTPNAFELSVEGLEIGDVLRVEDLADRLPAGAEFDIEDDRTVVTINAPISDAELEALEESAGIEEEEPEAVAEEAEDAEDAVSEGDEAEGEGPTEDEG